MCNKSSQKNFQECLEAIARFDTQGFSDQLATAEELYAAQTYVSEAAGVPLWWVTETSFEGDETPQDVRNGFLAFQPEDSENSDFGE